MRIDIGVVADAANISQEGKLNVTGVFSNIMAQTVPLTWPFMVLVCQFSASADEAGRTHAVRIRLVNNNGSTILDFPEMQIAIQPATQGNQIKIPYLVPITGLTFRRFGDYRFNVLINNVHTHDITITVAQPPTREN